MSGTSRTGSQTVVQVSQGWFGFFRLQTERNVFFPFTDRTEWFEFGFGLGSCRASHDKAPCPGGHGTYQSLVLSDFIRNVHLRYGPTF